MENMVNCIWKHIETHERDIGRLYRICKKQMRANHLTYAAILMLMHCAYTQHKEIECLSVRIRKLENKIEDEQ